LKFYTPEEFFLKMAPVKFYWDSINPKEYLEKVEKEGKELKIKVRTHPHPSF